MGAHDFAHKCHIKTAILGLSGGIDSALTACIAVDALGKDHVIGITMPSRFSSPGSVDDSILLAHHLGMRCDILHIEPMHAAYVKALHTPFAAFTQDTTEENIQARIRGTLLMAYANKLGGMLLNTGNKSETAVGYCTLYGDMNGALCVISDLYKTDVYALARFVNRYGERIPQTIIDKIPSAELRINQIDQDSLPPYDVLDAILCDLVEGGCDLPSLLAKGHDAPTVHRVVNLVKRAEFKRRQMPPGLRISKKAFGEGWRMPIARA
jgi:NAD+ synthase/NAD+ synthase (glutamine-hydrolysing)